MTYKTITFLALFIFSLSSLKADELSVPNKLKKAQIIEKLGISVDFNSFSLTDEDGEKILLGKYFSGNKPVALMFVYYECPSLCNFLLNGFTDAVRHINLDAGKDFEIVAISISPKEGPDLAKTKKAAYVQEYRRLGAEKGWHFLTGTKTETRSLAERIGFGYFYDEDIKEYAHSAGVFIFTPKGKLSRILYGIGFEPRDLKFAFLEAAGGKVGTILDRIQLFCYRYDPKAGGYSIYAMNIMRGGAALTLLLMLCGYLFLFLRRHRKSAVKKSGDVDEYKEAS